jgi:hypothetical protein
MSTNSLMNRSVPAKRMNSIKIRTGRRSNGNQLCCRFARKRNRSLLQRFKILSDQLLRRIASKACKLKTQNTVTDVRPCFVDTAFNNNTKIINSGHISPLEEPEMIMKMVKFLCLSPPSGKHSLNQSNLPEPSAQ